MAEQLILKGTLEGHVGLPLTPAATFLANGVARPPVADAIVKRSRDDQRDMR